MKRLAGEWLDYQMRVIPRDAPEVQVSESRRAFYAGAASLLALITGMLDPGLEPTDADIRRVDQLATELDEFWREVGAGRA